MLYGNNAMRNIIGHIVKLISLNTVTTDSLHALGYSSVLVLNAINAQLGRANCKTIDDPSKVKNPHNTRDTKKTEGKFVFTSSRSDKYEAKKNIATTFWSWGSKLQEMHNEFATDNDSTEYTIPSMFISWLDGFAKPVELENKSEETVSQPAS